MDEIVERFKSVVELCLMGWRLQLIAYCNNRLLFIFFQTVNCKVLNKVGMIETSLFLKYHRYLISICLKTSVFVFGSKMKMGCTKKHAKKLAIS